jgi:hypothetical protein
MTEKELVLAEHLGVLVLPSVLGGCLRTAPSLSEKPSYTP